MSQKDAAKPRYRLEHRLIGAVTLVLIAVIVIPLLLKEPQPEYQPVQFSAEEEGQKVFQSKIEALKHNRELHETLGKPDPNETPLNSVLKPINSDNPAVAEANVAQEPVLAVNTTSNNVPTSQPAPVVQPKIIETPAAKTADGNFELRVGTFSKRENADALMKLLNESGFKAQSTIVQTNLGDAIRIWIGPYKERETAEKIKTRLKSLTNQDSFVHERS